MECSHRRHQMQSNLHSPHTSLGVVVCQECVRFARHRLFLLYAVVVAVPIPCRSADIVPLLFVTRAALFSYLNLPAFLVCLHHSNHIIDVFHYSSITSCTTIRSWFGWMYTPASSTFHGSLILMSLYTGRHSWKVRSSGLILYCLLAGVHMWLGLSL